MEWWNALYDWLVANAEWVGFFVFLISALEAIAVVGIAIPGIAVLFALTLIAGKEGIDFWLVLWCGIAGAMVGDAISFWIGKYFKHRIESMWPFRSHPQWLAQGEAFFEKHGGKSIIIGRFIGPLRTFVPLCAGILNMPGWRFTFMNFLSALAWAPFHIFPGYFLGSAINHPLMPGKQQLWFLAGLIALIIAATWLALKVYQYGDPVFRKLADRYPSPRLTSVNHRPEEQLGALLIGLFCLLLFSALSYSLSIPSVQALDHQLTSYLNHLRQPFLDYVFVALSVFGNPKPMIAFSGLLLFYFLGRGEYGAVVHGLVVALACFILIPLFKESFEVTRPLHVVNPPSSYSYPSGHAVVSMMVWGYIGIVMARALPGSQVVRPLAAALTLIIFTSASRLYLGLHWFSDVIGGLLLGGGLLSLIRFSYYRFSQARLAARELTIVIIAAFSLITTVMVVPEMGKSLHSYEPLKPHLTKKLLPERKKPVQPKKRTPAAETPPPAPPVAPAETPATPPPEPSGTEQEVAAPSTPAELPAHPAAESNPAGAQ